MVERYTIKFGPAVSQKELERLLATGEGNIDPSHFHKLKARIEFVGEFEDVKKASEFIKRHSKKPD